jgi:hypothetical protein
MEEGQLQDNLSIQKQQDITLKGGHHHTEQALVAQSDQITKVENQMEIINLWYRAIGVQE